MWIGLVTGSGDGKPNHDFQDGWVGKFSGMASGWVHLKGFAEQLSFPISQRLEKGVINDDRLLGSCKMVMSTDTLH
jgi:hypothetical protein